MTLLAFGITWAAMLALLAVGRGRGGADDTGSEVDGMAGVELKQLHRRFGDVVALDGIDLEIAERRVRLASSGRPDAARRPRCG